MPEADPDPLETRIADYLCHRIPGADDMQVSALARIHGGISQETFRFNAKWSEYGKPEVKDLILRRAPEAGVVSSEHGVEFAIYEALANSSVPVPAAHFLEADPAWLDRPFFIMDMVPGRPGMIYGTDDPFDGKSERVGRDFWRHLGTLAARDTAALRNPGLRSGDTSDRFWQAELDYWEATLDQDEDIVEPIVRGAIRWLRANPPPEPAHPAIVHGDYRVGNFLFLPDGSISAILDWEMCHIGDPLEDIAWALDPLWSMDRYFPLDEGLATWEQGSGTTIDREALDWWRLFTAVKTSALWTTSEKSFEEGHNREIVLALTVLRAGPFHRKVILDLMEQRGAMG